MATEKQRKTFLSYSRINKDFAIRLAKELKSEGFDIWLDQLDIPAGARWDREVEKALRESEIFMIILTQASVDSENVLDEMGYAIDNGKRFLPVLLEKCDVPLRLRRFQYVDFTNKNFDEGVESAKELLRSLIAQPTIPRIPLSEEEKKQLAQPAEEQVVQTDADIERKIKEEADRLLAQKAEEERLAKAKADADRKAKTEARRKAKEEADRIAAQKAEEERFARTKAEKESLATEEANRLAVQKAEEELSAKAKAEKARKEKEEADRRALAKEEEERIAKAKADAEHKTEEKVFPAETKAAPVAFVPAQKKPALKGILIYGIAAFVVLAVIGIGLAALLNGRNKNTPAATPTLALTKAPTVAPTATPTLVPTPMGGGNGRIIFVSRLGDNSDIYIVNADGSELTRLTDNEASDYAPVWSPDGKHILFMSERNEPDPQNCYPCNTDIYIMNADGSEQTRLTENPESDESPVWSPDGKYILFMSDRDETDRNNCNNCNYELYIMNADGSGQTRLTDALGWDDSPAWSPDGNQIVFVSERDDPNPRNCDYCNGEIYIMNADGSGQTRLTEADGYDYNPVWSPDGKYILFTSERDEPDVENCNVCNDEIYIMNADGSGLTRLTDAAGYDYSPVWSIDGKHIVFISERDEPDLAECKACNSEIYIMNADGSGQTRLTDAEARDFSPVWQP